MKQLLFAVLRLLGINRLFRHLNQGRIKVLLYHHVMPSGSVFNNAVTPEEFRAHLRHLRRNFNVMGLGPDGEWKGYAPDVVNVLITFDDGFIDALQWALPILNEEHVPAVFFLIAESTLTGAPPAFAAKYAYLNPPQARTVGPKDVKVLLDAGMTIGSHGLTHTDYRELSLEQALDDAKRSRVLLEEISGKEVASFAFPWGHCAPGQKEQITGVYNRVFLTEHGFCDPGDRLVPRNEVATKLQLEAAASGSLDFVRRLSGR